MHVFELDDDGEVHLIVARSAEKAIEMGLIVHLIGEDFPERVKVRQIPDDQEVRVGFPDDPPEDDDVPDGGSVDGSVVTATAAQWVEGCLPGAILGSSVY